MRILFPKRYLTRQEEQGFRERIPDLSPKVRGIDVPTGIIPRDPSGFFKRGFGEEYFNLEALIPLREFEEIRKRALQRFSCGDEGQVTPETIFSREFFFKYQENGLAERYVKENICEWAEQNNSLFFNESYLVDTRSRSWDRFEPQLGGNFFTVSSPSPKFEYITERNEMLLVVPVSSGRMIFDPEKPRIYLADAHDERIDRQKIRAVLSRFINKHTDYEVVFPEKYYSHTSPTNLASHTLFCERSLEETLGKELLDRNRFPDLRAVMPCKYRLCGYASRDDLDMFLQGLKRSEGIKNRKQHKLWEEKCGAWISDRIRDFFRADPRRMILSAVDILTEDSLHRGGAREVESLINITLKLGDDCFQTIEDSKCYSSLLDQTLNGGLSRSRYYLLPLSAGILIPDPEDKRILVKYIKTEEHETPLLRSDFQYEAIHTYIKTHLPDYNVQFARISPFDLKGKKK
jgi:hypothetical protein